MNTPLFSLLHSTMGRPRKAVDAMIQWHAHAMYPKSAEYIFSCNADDPTTSDLISMLVGTVASQGFCGRVRVLMNQNCNGSARAWDLAAEDSTGSILIQAQDDIEPPVGWDTLIEQRIIAGVGPNSTGILKPAIVAVSDGYRKDRLLCTAICNRARYIDQGHFLYRGYKSVFSDDEFSYRAYRDEAYGKCIVVHAEDLVFKHEHYAHNKSVPYDATYAHENSAAAYAVGQKLFFERNPEAVTDGVRDWK